jgi:hypothetical protein
MGLLPARMHDTLSCLWLPRGSGAVLSIDAAHQRQDSLKVLA